MIENAKLAVVDLVKRNVMQNISYCMEIISKDQKRILARKA
jgi:hypothetical protein